MASGEYVVGRDIDFQYADNAPAAGGDAAAGARKKSKKKAKKKKQSASQPASETSEQRDQPSRARIESQSPEKQTAQASHRRDAALSETASPSNAPGTKATPPSREKRRVANSKPGKHAGPAEGDTKSISDLLHGPNSAFPHLRNKHLPHSQPDHRHREYSPEKDPEMSLTTSSEEKERIRQFWRQLSQEEREKLAKLDKDVLFQRIRRQRRDCTCTVCGRQREAVEEELEELYTMNYDKLKRYSAKLLECEVLFSDERPAELGDGDDTALRRREIAIDSYLGQLDNARASPSAQNDTGRQSRTAISNSPRRSTVTNSQAQGASANQPEQPRSSSSSASSYSQVEHVHSHDKSHQEASMHASRENSQKQGQSEQHLRSPSGHLEPQQSDLSQTQHPLPRPQQSQLQNQFQQGLNDSTSTDRDLQPQQLPHTHTQTREGMQAAQHGESLDADDGSPLTDEILLKNRHPLDMLYAHLPPAFEDGTPVPLLPEASKHLMNLPTSELQNSSGEYPLSPSLVPPGQGVDSWRRVTKTFQDLVMDHLTKSRPTVQGSQALSDAKVLEIFDKAVLGDSQVLEILDKVVRAGRVDPGSLAGGIMGLADDLLRNDGKQFMNMYEEQQAKPGAEQVLQPLKQLYDNYRMAEGISDTPDLISRGSDGQTGSQATRMRTSPGFNLTVRVDTDAPLPGIHERAPGHHHGLAHDYHHHGHGHGHDQGHDDEDEEFEDAVEEELEYENEAGFVDELDDELEDELDDYTDGYSDAEGSTNSGNPNDITDYSSSEGWTGTEAYKREASERKRLIEGYAMLRTFTARVFEQRVLQAYREQVARERQQLLLQELAEEESRAAKEREQRKVKEKEKKKNKKALAKQQREEEQRLKQIEQERAREEQRLKDEQRRLQQLELDRVKQEAHRRKIEERMARMELEAKEREAVERQRDVERLRMEKEKAEKEERGQREQMERLEREKTQRESAVRDMLEREKAAKEKSERKRKQKEEKAQRERERERERLENKEIKSTPRQPAQGPASVDSTSKFPIPPMSSPFGYPLQQGLQTGGLRGSNITNQSGPHAGSGLMSPAGQPIPSVLQPGSIPEPHHISSTGFQPGLATSGMHTMHSSSLSPNLPMQALSFQQKQTLLQNTFPTTVPQPSPTLSSLWSTTPAQQSSSPQPSSQQHLQEQQAQQAQQSQKWNSWTPWSSTSEERSTPDLGRTPSPQFHHTHSPWSKGGSMWSTSHTNELADICRAAQSSYEVIVKDGMGVDGYVPGQVLYHAALDASGGRFSQNDLYKALAQLPSFECIRDDVGLITHVKIAADQ